MTETSTLSEQVAHGPEFLTPDDLANIYRIPKATQAKMRWASTGPSYVKLGARVLYRRVDVDNWIAANMHNATVTTNQENSK